MLVVQDVSTQEDAKVIAKFTFGMYGMVEEVSKVVPELDNWMHTVQIPDTTLFESFGSGQSAAHSAYNNIRSEGKGSRYD